MVNLPREKKKIKSNNLTIFFLVCFQKPPMRMGGVEAREARLLLISLFGPAPSSLRFLFPFTVVVVEAATSMDCASVLY